MCLVWMSLFKYPRLIVLVIVILNVHLCFNSAQPFNLPLQLLHLLLLDGRFKHHHHNVGLSFNETVHTINFAPFVNNQGKPPI